MTVQGRGGAEQAGKSHSPPGFVRKGSGGPEGGDAGFMHLVGQGERKNHTLTNRIAEGQVL